MASRELRYILDHWDWFERCVRENKQNITQLLNPGEGGQGGEGFMISGVVDNYDALLIEYPNPVQFEFVYVMNSQGTAWLPGSVGGTYWGAGLYIYDGVKWVLDKDEIHLALSALNSTNVVTKAVDYTAFDGDVILVDTTSGSITITIPIALNTKVIVKKTDISLNKVIIVGATGLVDGVTTAEISSQYTSLTLYGDGTNLSIH